MKNERNTTAESQPRRALIVAGGTGGHIAPALAVGEYLRAEYGDDVVVRYVTGSRSTEKRCFESAAEFPDILACGEAPSLRRNPLGSTKSYIRSFAEARAMIRRFDPHVVFATGGYVCAPVLVAARTRRIPYFLHESNAIPGRVTRLFAGGAQLTFTAFSAARPRIRRGTPVVSGTPVRSVLREARREQAIAHYGLNPNARTVLLLGGSQGARALNDAMLDAVTALSGTDVQPLNVIWGCGPLNLQTVERAVARLDLPQTRVVLRDFIDEMELAYAAADLVVSRAGASTLAEISALGLPSVLVPYPFAMDNHQEENARAFAEAGASLVLNEQRLTGRLLAGEVRALLTDTDRLEAMAAAAESLGTPECLRLIGEALMGEFTLPRTEQPGRAPEAAERVADHAAA